MINETTGVESGGETIKKMFSLAEERGLCPYLLWRFYMLAYDSHRRIKGSLRQLNEKEFFESLAERRAYQLSIVEDYLNGKDILSIYQRLNQGE